MRLKSTLPAPTLAQRIASMSTAELMVAARALATQGDEASEAACTAVLEALEARVPGPSFDAFVDEIYGPSAPSHEP